ncbi:hypothetical protein AB0D65_09450 [Streptomyces griseoloalbus]|uniref:Uncharacterized protein n=1 Tax=Streptomyces griseoloalbus TaxID=67303 RepID=A0ABV3E253_9ACTN
MTFVFKNAECRGGARPPARAAAHKTTSSALDALGAPCTLAALSALSARHLAHSGTPVLAIGGDIERHLAQALAPASPETTRCTRGTPPRPAECP